MAKLYFRYGAMGCGKTIDLLKVAYNYEERNRSVVMLTSSKDDRFGTGKITTRIGLQRDAIAVTSDMNIFELISRDYFSADCVLVDEANLLSEKNIEELSDVVDKLNITVICYGLRADFRSNLFEGSKKLMEIADEIEEIVTICECGNKAVMNMRMIDGKATCYGPQILIGGNDTYKAVCRKCYKKYLSKLNKINDEVK